MLGSSAMFGSTQGFGGFGDSQAPAAASPDAGAKKARVEEKQTCLPVTIRAIESAVKQRADTSDDLKFYGAEPGALILVAVLENVVRQSTGLEMTLNDATGRIKARYFVTDPQPGELEKFAPGTYVCAFGGVRSAPTTHFAINGLRTVESADEVSYHAIEVAHAMLSLQQPAQGVQADAPVTRAAPVGPAETVTPQKVPSVGATPAASPGLPATPAAVAEPPVASVADAQAPKAGPLRGKVLSDAIMALMRDESLIDPTEGLSVDVIIAKLTSATAGDIRDTIKTLVAEGEMFESIDENHFLAV